MLNKTLLPTEAKVELQKWQMFQKCNTGWCIACLQFICTVMAISFGNDKCCVLQGLLVQYLRKKNSIEYWNTIGTGFLGQHFSINANSPLFYSSQSAVKIQSE